MCRSILPPQFTPHYTPGMVPPRLTLIRPAKSPVNTLQRQLLRQSSMGPLLTYALTIAYLAYILIRAADAFWLYTYGHGIMISHDDANMDVDAQLTAEESGVDTTFARDAASEQLAADEGTESAWRAAQDDIGGLLWRLVVVAVEAVYGAAAVAWSAMASGAFSFMQNCRRCGPWLFLGWLITQYYCLVSQGSAHSSPQRSEA